MPITHWLSLATISAVLLGVNGCKQKSSANEEASPSTAKLEAHPQDDEPSSVLFETKLSNSCPVADGFQLYDCTYQSEGKTAKFRLEFRQCRQSTGDIPLRWGEGKFLAVAGSENSVLLRDLQEALDAKRMPESFARVKELAFDAAVLGEHQSRDRSDVFSSKPPGDWTAIKIFLPKGGDDGEVFLNLNPVLGKGEFSIKDSEYGDYLLKEFAKVL